MRAQINGNATDQVLPAGSRGPLDEVLLSRWVPAEAKFVVGRFDWGDPLDAALGLQLVRFRPGIDPYDA